VRISRLSEVADKRAYASQLFLWLKSDGLRYKYRREQKNGIISLVILSLKTVVRLADKSKNCRARRIVLRRRGIGLHVANL